MKIRSGFVSNSSSSSFIVIDTKDNNIIVPVLPEHLIVDGDLGTTEFGWQNERYYDFGSKLIFAYLQTIYEDSKRKADIWLSMIAFLLSKSANVKKIEWRVSPDEYSGNKNYAYIDHASSASEKQNIEMFDSEESLRGFLFGINSFIQNENDNE